MSPLLESIWIALQSIWANKLRSFLTVLGNIVAVTSIVTVVSLIQGMNATVSDAIVGRVGADSFTVQRVPLIRTEADEERTRAFPLITVEEAKAIRAFSPVIDAVVAQTPRRGAVTYRGRELVDGLSILDRQVRAAHDLREVGSTGQCDVAELRQEDRIRSERIDRVAERLIESANQGRDPDDRRDPDHDAQHRQARLQLVGAQCLERHPDGLAEQPLIHGGVPRSDPGSPRATPDRRRRRGQRPP